MVPKAEIVETPRLETTQALTLARQLRCYFKGQGFYSADHHSHGAEVLYHDTLPNVSIWPNGRCLVHDGRSAANPRSIPEEGLRGGHDGGFKTRGR